MVERIALALGSGDIEDLQRRLRELGDSATEELRGRIKQFVKDSKTEFGLYEQIRDQFINSPDEDIRKFVGLIQRPFYASSSGLSLHSASTVSKKIRTRPGCRPMDETHE